MQFLEVIELGQVKLSKDGFGGITEAIAFREVFAEKQSIGMKEVYEGHARGLKPEIKFILSDYLDYENEEFIKFNDVLYKVIRTYQSNGTHLEIVCERTLNKGVKNGAAAVSNENK